jgi:hypothetical protein
MLTLLVTACVGFALLNTLLKETKRDEYKCREGDEEAVNISGMNIKKREETGS